MVTVLKIMVLKVKALKATVLKVNLVLKVGFRYFKVTVPKVTVPMVTVLKVSVLKVLTTSTAVYDGDVVVVIVVVVIFVADLISPTAAPSCKVARFVTKSGRICTKSH